MFLFKCYQYDTDRGIRVDSYYGLVKKKKREVDFTTSMMFLFLQNNIKQIYYIYTLFFRNDYNGVD
jgi:TRAP-type mannitol/chloroaromatic compound transport system permease small subunit